jgi:hypothetical protein
LSRGKIAEAGLGLHFTANAQVIASRKVLPGARSQRPWPNLVGCGLKPNFHRTHEIEKAEQGETTLEKAEVLYMRPTDLLSMK